MNTSDTTRPTVPNGLSGRNDESCKPPTSFEDALLLTGLGKFHWLLSFGCGFCVIAMMGEAFSSAFIIPVAQCEFNMDASEKGLLNAISYIGMISSSHLWGYLADTRGRRKTLLVALVLDAICGLLSSFAHSYWLFVVLRFLCGFFVCAPSAVVFAYLGEFHSGLTRSKAVMLMSVFLSFGALYQQGFAWLIIPQDWALYIPWLPHMFRPWRLFIILNVVPSIAAASILFFLPESPKFLFNNTKEKEAVEVLRRMFAVNTGRNVDEYPVERVTMDKQEIGSVAVIHPTSVLEIVKSMWLQTKPLFQTPNLSLTIVACLMQFALFASFSGFGLWLPDLYNRLAVYSELRPNDTVTICEVVSGLLEMNAAPHTFIHSTEIDIQMLTEVDNLTYTELMTANNTVTVPISPFGSSVEDTARYDVVVDFQNTTALADVVSATNGTWLHNDTTPTPSCSANINEDVFRNTMAIGVVCAFVYISSCYLVGCIDKKKLIMTYTLTSTVSGALLLAVKSEVILVLLSSVFMATGGVSVNILNIVVIDNIPTNLRAMAVCLSLMMGRLGVTVFSLILGILLDFSCTAAICLLSGTVLACCFLTYLLPGSPKNVR